MVRTFISLILSLWAGLAYADQASITIPESQNAFNATYGTSGQVTFGPLASRALNPALKTIASNFAGTNCGGIAIPVPYQWCVDTTAKTVRMYTPDNSGAFSFHDAFNIQTDGTIVPTNGGGGGGAVSSVAGRTGAVTLSVADISGALAAASPSFTGTLTGPNATLSGALNAGTSTTTGTTQAQTLVSTGQTLAGSIAMANAAIVADSTTDISAALNAALTAGDVILPQGSGSNFYRAASTITVPFGRTLRGWGNASLQASGSTAGGARIVCDAAVTPCIRVGTGNFNTMASMYNITQSRAGGTPASGTIGVWVFGGDNSRLIDVTSDNNEINFLWGRSTPGSGAGISNFGTRLTSTRATGAHHSFDGIPDVRISDSHVGANGNTDYHASAAFRFTCTQHNCAGAGAANTIVVHNTQVNQASHSIDHFAEFVDAGPSFGGADFGDITFSDVHAEVVNNAFYSDSSWLQIKHVNIANSIINTSVTSADGVGGRFFKLDAATAVYKWNLMGNNFFAVDEGGVAAYRLAPAPASGPGIAELHWMGGNVSGNVYLTGFNNSTAWIGQVSFNDNFTADGSFQVFSELGDNIGGTYSESVSGGQTIFNNRAVKNGGVVGVTCNAGISATTGRSVRGIITAC
jgi:hypothetical protein